MTPEEKRQLDLEETIADFIRHPLLAHRTLFRHRHSQRSADFHPSLIKQFHDMRVSRVIAMIFRGGAKSTLAEETTIIKACTRQFKNGLLIGENEDRAKERLRSVRHEFETNQWLHELFGNLRGATWGETKIELSTGIMIQAYGRGQALRGAKYLDQRPDFVICDDLEDQESVLTSESREKVNDWFWQVLIPGLDSPTRTPIRMLATPLHEKALAVSLAKLEEFAVIKVPIESVDPISGEKRSSWPARFPLVEIEKLRQSFFNSGNSDKFEQEYMCEVSDPSQKVFTSGMFRYDPMVRTYQAVYAVYDPARTVKKTSARTGKVVGSWVRNRLVVWEAAGELWKPDEIIADMFAMDDIYRPVAIGVEEDGLNEFIMQPLRHAQMNRGQPLPIRPLKAPRGKFDFIRSLQPYFKAGEVILAGDASRFTALTEQLLNFRPGYSGLIDVPNALAYFLKIRPGAPVYDGFSSENVEEDIDVQRGPIHCCLEADHGHVIGVLCQFTSGRLSILADYLREGDPANEIERIIGDARLAAAGAVTQLRFVASRKHFHEYDRIGLRAGGIKSGVTILKGGDEAKGRAEIVRLLGGRVGAMPALRVSTGAQWTLRALQGGYARKLTKAGGLGSEPEENVYATIMRAIESFAALTGGGEGDDNQRRVEYSEEGRPYLSARA